MRIAGEGWQWGVAAGLASITVAIGLWIGFLEPDNRYVTGVGEQRTLQLDDGSVVYLNVHSRLELHFTRTARELRLTDGEALFKVARDASRPFRVYADETVIQALGTQFNVHRRPSGTVVSVIEGTVRVKDETLAAGEEVQFEDSGRRLAKREVTDLRNVTAWRQHRLVFQDETLADIAAEFNRYNLAPQIRVEGDVARARHFAGTFDADAPQALIEALKADTALVFERAGDEIVIRSR